MTLVASLDEKRNIQEVIVLPGLTADNVLIAGVSAHEVMSSWYILTECPPYSLSRFLQARLNQCCSEPEVDLRNELGNVSGWRLLLRTGTGVPAISFLGLSLHGAKKVLPITGVQSFFYEGIQVESRDDGMSGGLPYFLVQQCFKQLYMQRNLGVNY